MGDIEPQNSEKRGGNKVTYHMYLATVDRASHEMSHLCSKIFKKVGGAWEQGWCPRVLLPYLLGTTLPGGCEYNRVCECLR